MLKTRLIPILLIKDGLLVRSELFKFHHPIGKPAPQIERYNSWNVDELILLDISEKSREKENDADSVMIQLLKEISKKCFMPLTVGGGIQNMSGIHQRILHGADKITINTEALLRPAFITEAAKEFGSQAIVVSIDVKRRNVEDYEVFSHGGQIPTGKKIEEWATEVESLGAGEILLNSIDRDGTGLGYDLSLVQKIVDQVSIPVICCGGAKKWEDFMLVVNECKASGVAAGNFFHFKEISYNTSKHNLKKFSVNVR